jgi:hypothetical protein
MNGGGRNNQDEQIKHVITGMSVNHDPNGVVSLHADGFPVQTNLSVTFQETEFITSKDTADDSYVDSMKTSMINQAQSARAKGTLNQTAEEYTTGRLKAFKNPRDATRGF